MLCYVACRHGQGEEARSGRVCAGEPEQVRSPRLVQLATEADARLPAQRQLRMPSTYRPT